jgi:hypothetical protein
MADVLLRVPTETAGDPDGRLAPAGEDPPAAKGDLQMGRRLLGASGELVA